MKNAKLKVALQEAANICGIIITSLIIIGSLDILKLYMQNTIINSPPKTKRSIMAAEFQEKSTPPNVKPSNTKTNPLVKRKTPK